MKYCPSCKLELAEHANFCSRCGRALSECDTIDGVETQVVNSFALKGAQKAIELKDTQDASANRVDREDAPELNVTTIPAPIAMRKGKQAPSPIHTILSPIQSVLNFVFGALYYVWAFVRGMLSKALTSVGSLLSKVLSPIWNVLVLILKPVRNAASKTHVFLNGMLEKVWILLRFILSKLPAPIRRMVALLLTRVADPAPEKVSSAQASSLDVVSVKRVASLKWLAILSLISSFGVLSVAYAYTSSRYNVVGVDAFFWWGVLIVYVPPLIRMISPAPSSFERISLLCIMGVYFFLIHEMSSPLAFTSHDALVHWRTIEDITRSRHLFTQNYLLSASPFYPGLEITTNALSTLSGLSDFQAGMIVLCMARLIMTLSLFLLYEKLTSSARIASIAVLIYMANPHFLFFDVDFSYESLALPLASLMLFAMFLHDETSNNYRKISIAGWLIIAAIAVTHHMTDFISDGLLILWTVAYLFQRPVRYVLNSHVTKTALFAILCSILWVNTDGNPVINYLSSYYGSALGELGQILSGVSKARPLFDAYAGQSPPLWEKLISTFSVLLIFFLLPFGLLCIWKRYRKSSFACMLGVAALLYPLSHVFRFTNFGSEITDRAAAFLFIPLSFVTAVFITQFWPVRLLNRWRTMLIAGIITVLFLGGVILEVGAPWELLPAPYLISADEHSVEPEGIQDAIWTRSFLGINNRIASDRINELLVSAYGIQRPITSNVDGIDVETIFASPQFDADDEGALKYADVHYLVVDRRISEGLPYLGFYFEPGEHDAFHYTKPISLSSLTKFDTVPGINRIFDSGNIVIYDMGEIVNGP